MTQFQIYRRKAFEAIRKLNPSLTEQELWQLSEAAAQTRLKKENLKKIFQVRFNFDSKPSENSTAYDTKKES